MEGNLRFQIDCASIVGSKFTVLAYCFTLYLRAVFQVQSPPPPHLGGVIFGGVVQQRIFCITILGAYTWRGLLWNFTVITY